MYYKKLMKRIKYNKKRRTLFLALVIFALCLGLGYAYISTTLEVNGDATFRRSTWDVHLDNSTISVDNGSVTAITAPSATGTNLNFSVRLENQGDYYAFTIDVVNNGSINASLSNYTLTPVLTTEQSKYLTFEVTNTDGTPLNIGEMLNGGSRKTIKVKAQYNTGLDVDDYPIIDEAYDFNIRLDYSQ